MRLLTTFDKVQHGQQAARRHAKVAGHCRRRVPKFPGVCDLIERHGVARKARQALSRASTANSLALVPCPDEVPQAFGLMQPMGILGVRNPECICLDVVVGAHWVGAHWVDEHIDVGRSSRCLGVNRQTRVVGDDVRCAKADVLGMITNDCAVDTHDGIKLGPVVDGHAPFICQELI